jgi:FAD/FMN-containing dehydrogenase
MAKKKDTKPGRKLPTFQGSIVESTSDALTTATGVVGAHQVWFPKTKADVAAAVARSRNQLTLVRSGVQAATTDVAEAAGGIVINLAALNNIAIKAGVVSAEAAATTRDVAESLEEHGLALPLLDNPQKSIVSNALDDGPSCLVRTLGPLSDYVSKLTGVTPAGQPMTRSGSSALEKAKADNAVITGVTFKPVRATGLWLLRKSFLYPGKDHFATLVKALFLNSQIPQQCDIVLEAVSGRHDIPVVRIMAAGSGPKRKAAATSLVDTSLASLPAGLAQEIVTENHAGSSVIRTIVESGPGIPLDPEVDANRIFRVVEPPEETNGFLNRVVEDVDRGLGFDGSGKRDESLRLFARLQLDRENRLTLSGFVYTPRPPAPARPAPLASVDFVARVETPLHAAPAFPQLFAPRIPNFSGSVHIPSDLLYERYATQYATSSYKKEDMSPFMVAYPRDVADVRAAITFARARHKRLVARSGGHQYSGTSSGGDGTIVLSMDRFDRITRVSGNVFDVGPAVPLTRLARYLAGQGVTIPHGECPLVCIGGHAQTGGFGHLLRGFGLTLDYVRAFTIVLADGSVRTVQRPAGAPATDDDELFWGVLGGNAGSFGIVTNYRFECIKDSDHTRSYGYTAARLYRKGRYKNLMKQVQAWTQGVASGTLRPDVDFMMTVASKSDTLRPPFPTLLVELVHSNLGGPAEVVDAEQAFEPIMTASDSETPIWELLPTIKGTRSLSELSDSFVRRYPFTTLDGREFRQPYQKRINCSTSALTDAFVDSFVDLVDKVVTATDGVYLIFQMLIGGGSLQRSTRRAATSIPRRDFVFCFVFDLFYDTGKKQAAEQLQEEMQSLINAHFSPAQEQRLLWGTFGDADITKDAVRNYYYDDPAVYARLQRLKKQVDPDDLFHSRLTVKQP